MTLTSFEPATGRALWTGEVGDAAAEVAAARAAFPAWAAQPVTYRAETLRRFANVVRAHEAEFARLIAAETGKPLWEAKTEVGAVVNKVEISITAYMERTGTTRQARTRCALVRSRSGGGRRSRGRAAPSPAR